MGGVRSSIPFVLGSEDFFEQGSGSLLVAVQGVVEVQADEVPDKGPDRFKMYCALGIVTYNLHKVGNILLEQEREFSKNKQYKKAA